MPDRNPPDSLTLLVVDDEPATGTPSGVGWFRDPKRLLRDGDEVAVDIEHVGRLMNRCREERPG